VSRTPVREALSRLEQEGFVRRDGGWGYIVCSVTLKDARELYKVREALEAEAVREAVAHAKSHDIAALDALLKKAEQARSRKKVPIFRLNTRAFHAYIAQLANNTLLARMLRELEHRVQLLGALVFENHPLRMDEVIQENRQILRALKRGDAAQAELQVRGHVRRAWESYVMYVAEDVDPAVEIDVTKQRRMNGQAAIR
jgi:DNA-binding GntR family transcriptional regulator